MGLGGLLNDEVVLKKHNGGGVVLVKQLGKKNWIGAGLVETRSMIIKGVRAHGRVGHKKGPVLRTGP